MTVRRDQPDHHSNDPRESKFRQGFRLAFDIVHYGVAAAALAGHLLHFPEPLRWALTFAELSMLAILAIRKAPSVRQTRLRRVLNAVSKVSTYLIPMLGLLGHLAFFSEAIATGLTLICLGLLAVKAATKVYHLFRVLNTRG